LLCPQIGCAYIYTYITSINPLYNRDVSEYDTMSSVLSAFRTGNFKGVEPALKDDDIYLNKLRGILQKKFSIRTIQNGQYNKVYKMRLKVK
jgi:hypothetical protein